MKAFHNGTIGKFLAIGFAILIHGSFAAGAYFLGRYLGALLFSDLPAGAEIGGIGLAALVFGGAMFGFIYLEYAKEDVEAYEMHKGNGSFRRSLWIIQVAIVLTELASLIFRVFTITDPVRRSVVFLLGIAFLVIAYALGKIIHAMANRPPEISVYRARQQAARSVVDDSMKLIPKMTAEQKLRFYNGDGSVIDEVRDAKQDEKLQEERRRTDQQKRTEREREASKSFTDSILHPFGGAQTNQSQSDRLSNQSGNGRQIRQ